MDWITDLDSLHAHYGTPKPPSLRKVAPVLTPAYAAFIRASRFCIVSTVGPEGTDGSPRGDREPVVELEGRETILLPDWQGNERIDSLRNIVRDDRISLCFFVPGSLNVVRVNGQARITADAGLRARFEREGKHPRTVVVIRVAEVYSQCARAIQRAELWTSGDLSPGLPSVGQMLQEASNHEIDGAAYDAERATRAHLAWW